MAPRRTGRPADRIAIAQTSGDAPRCGPKAVPSVLPDRYLRARERRTVSPLPPRIEFGAFCPLRERPSARSRAWRGLRTRPPRGRHHPTNAEPLKPEGPSGSTPRPYVLLHRPRKVGIGRETARGGSSKLSRCPSRVRIRDGSRWVTLRAGGDGYDRWWEGRAVEIVSERTSLSRPGMSVPAPGPLQSQHPASAF